MPVDDPPRPANLPPGYDEADPYADEDLSTYPDWWRRNINEFREHGMRPYRPPRFTDGKYTPEVIRTLESELDVDIQLRGINPQTGSDWEIRVNGETIGGIGRRREGEGFTLYETTAAEFETRVRAAVTE